MFVVRKENESNNDTCARCIAEYTLLSCNNSFDYSACTHCEISQEIHEKDSKLWNGHCHFLR